jgi:hypothetical protein
MASLDNTTVGLEHDDEWKRPSQAYHAHFDCFSGAAGDMMLAACLDAANELQQQQPPNNIQQQEGGCSGGQLRLLKRIIECLEKGMPELKGEFSIRTKRVWRGGMASMAGLHVTVQSRYHHAPAPLPIRSHDTANDDAPNMTLTTNHHHHHEAMHKETNDMIALDNLHGHQHCHEHSSDNADHGDHHQHPSNPPHVVSQSAEHETKSENGSTSPEIRTTELSHSHDHQHSHDHNHEHGHSHEHIHTDPMPNSTPKEQNHNHNHDETTTLASRDGSRETMSSHSHDHQDSRGHCHGHGHTDPLLNDNSEEQNHHHGHDHTMTTTTVGPLRNLPQIQAMLEQAPEQYIPVWVRETAIATFTRLAHAEAKVHGADSANVVYFHEVGAIDSIVDTIGTLQALYYLGVTSVSCSRLPIGEGTVWTAHGILPVPAPATLRLLAGMPLCQVKRKKSGVVVLYRVLCVCVCRIQECTDCLVRNCYS